MPKVSSHLSVFQFGERLLNTGDLDPVYILLWNAQFNLTKMYHWLLAYWCFYHVGTASWIVDQDDYWKAFRIAAGSKDYPRCPERRHFRGENAIKSVEYLQNRDFFDLRRDIEGKPVTLREQMELTQQWVGFGPWISFKIADMLERLNLRKIDFSGWDWLYESPRDGAWLVYQEEFNKGSPVNAALAIAETVERLIEHFQHTPAPPRYDRGVNVQEIETILCKYKSYRSGHYKIGEDIEGCKKALEKFPESETAFQLRMAGRDLW